jgi:hypothetical protein
MGKGKIMKTIWLSALKKDETAVQQAMSRFKTYGIKVQGHYWDNDNAKLAWLGARESLLGEQIAMWAILGDRDVLESGDLRYGLSMVALGLQARRGTGYPMVILQSDGPFIAPDTLPTALSRAMVLDAKSPGTPAKLIAKLHARAPDPPAAYHIDMLGSPQLGQWLQIQPVGQAWPGVIFGVDDGEIVFQAVGPAGRLPEKTILNHAMQGLKLELGDMVFSAWATRNEISPDTAYFVKISGTPRTLLLGPYAEQSQADLYIVHLQ